ncbi:hypothetical protein L3073_13880 [Ancylomarina sp. DW003]|nr:hypothetical protein [Ancylomarina sp. DW003]MDE5423304.1 hypothetical protein [Ancylomarina sp. DW003]
MRSNLVKFDKPVLTNEIEYDLINSSQKQNLHRIVLNKLSDILNKDINKGLGMLEQMLNTEEIDAFKLELQSKLSSKKKLDDKSISYKGRFKTLKSCFEGLPADNIL